MGGTDNIENPGPYLHRNSKKVPYMGVLSREDAVKAYMAQLDFGQDSSTPTLGASPSLEAALVSGSSPASGGGDEPFSPISVPLYPKDREVESQDLASVRTPRWRGS